MRGELTAKEVLEKATATPEPARGEILFASGNYRFTRAAVLEAGTSEVRLQHVRALFIQSNYSWSDPLSARSFVAWRRRLADKRDSITAIREEGGRQFYRVRTSSYSSTLHSASLTLEAVNYHPTKARFEFQDEDPIEVSEQVHAPGNKPREAPAAEPVAHPKIAESVAGPEDELRVFAALDAIGADADEAIDVKLDPSRHSVLVTGMGMPADRRKQIEAALASLPNTTVRFSVGRQIDKELKTVDNSNATPENAVSPLRDSLQKRAGGARQLQTISDESMETSNTLFAQAHSLRVLAQQFKPSVEAALTAADANTLLALRQRRLGVMSYAVRRLRDQLKPLLTEEVISTEKTRADEWQTTAENLYEATRNLDQLLSRLLAGSYDEQSGELMLKQLPDDISKVETLIVADSR